MRINQRGRKGLIRERWIMVISSVFVLGALTIAGIYIRDWNQTDNDGYVVDFSAIENSAPGKAEEIAGTQLTENITDEAVTSDDLDYDPFFQEANSKQVKNYESAVDLPQDVKEQIGQPEVQTKVEAEIASNVVEGEIATDVVEAEIVTSDVEIGDAVLAAEPATQEDTPAISTAMQSALTFNDEDTLVWPIVGNVLINYSMDKTVFFPTLKQYKYNPAIIIQATEGDIITAAAAGKVTSVFNDPQIGQGVVMELGNGYEVTYGQLENIVVSEGSFVASGDVIADVAAPTKYFSVEGTNVYFKLTKDQKPVNPMTKLD